MSEILVRVPAKQLMTIYKVATFDGVDSFLQQVANARGKLKRGGVVDVEVSHDKVMASLSGASLVATNDPSMCGPL